MSGGVAGEGVEKPAWTGTSYTIFSAYQDITQVEEKEHQGGKAGFLESQPLLDTDVALTLEEAVLERLLAHTVCCSSDNICFRHLPWRPLAVSVLCIALVQLFAWVVNSRARLANNEGLFCHSESNHRGNSITQTHIPSSCCSIVSAFPATSPLFPSVPPLLSQLPLLRYP